MNKKLTKKAIDALTPESKPEILWDGEVSGFGVRVRPTGRKYFFIKYRTKANRQRWYTIGRYGSPWTVDNARDRARKILTKVKDGGDPIAERGLEKGIPTVKEFSKHYLKEVESGAILTKFGTPKKKSTIATDKTRINNYIIPLLGKSRLDAVTQEDVVKFRNQVTKGRGEDNRKARGGRGAASKTLGLLSVIFSRAIKEKYITVNPVVGVKRPKDRKLERFLTLKEFTRLGTALALAEENKSETEYVIAAIRLLIFTGCRRSEILKLQWAQVDTQRAMLFLTDSKTGPKPVYLSAPALDILKNLTKEAKNPYVICGTKKAYHADITRPWERIKKQAELTDVRLHDLRHSYASIGASGGVPLQIIGKLLGHANISTTERYAHLTADPIKAANEAMAKTIQRALTGTPNAENRGEKSDQ